MIWTALRTSWLNLKRDHLALILSFVVPVVFFTVFASIFAQTGGSGSTYRMVILDLAKNEFSKPLIENLRQETDTFRFPDFSTSTDEDGNETRKELTEEQVSKLVSDGKVSLGLVFPEGFKIRFDGPSPQVRVYADTRANPIAYQMINGILQKVAMTETPQLVLGEGMSMLKKFGGELTVQQKLMVESLEYALALKGNTESGSEADSGESKSQADAAGSVAFNGLVSTEILDVRDQADERRGRRKRASVSFYAAGIAVMFLLFSMTGAASDILEEEEMGTLERVLDSRLGLNGFLFGHWLFTTALGFLQVTAMFVWAALVFGLNLWSPLYLSGFVVVTAVTAAAAAAFGLMLGTFCRTRGQLNGLSTTVVLIMSALGGSMIPRFIMKQQSATMEAIGNLTFNAWALDAYENVFWRDKAFWETPIQLLVLITMNVVFLGLAWIFAQRWNRK